MTDRKKDANLLEKDDDILELILKKFRIKFRCEYFILQYSRMML